MTITIEYTNYPEIISLVTIDTSATEDFIVSLVDANNIKIQANNDTDTVDNTMTKEELLDYIKVLQMMANLMT